MRWKCFVLLFALATAVADQVPSSDEYDTWWSDEVNNDQLGVDKPADYAQVDNQYYDDSEEQTANDDAAEPEQSDLFKDLFENQNNEKEPVIDQNENQDDTIKHSVEQNQSLNAEITAVDSKQVQEQLDDADVDDADQISAPRDDYSEAVRDDIEQAKQELDGLKDALALDQPEGESENLDDYQIEDNRSQGKEQNKADLPSENHGSFETKDVIADQKTELKNPELLRAVDITSELDQDLNLLSETKAQLEEQNSPSEENFETDLQAEIMKSVNKNEKSNEFAQESFDQQAVQDLLEEKNSPSEEDFEVNQQAVYEVPENDKEKSEAHINLDNKSTEELNQFFEDVIENNQNEEIKSYLDDNQSKQAEKTQDESSHQDNAKVKESPTLDESIKYENDMIDLEVNADSNGGFKQSQSDLVDDDNDSDEDTVDKVYEDLNADLEKLLEIGRKLADNAETEEVVEDVVGYEEKFNKPYGEDTILSQRQDYYDEMNDESVDSNFGDIFDSQPTADSGETENDPRKSHLTDVSLELELDLDNIEKTDTTTETNVKTVSVIGHETKSDINDKTTTETESSTTFRTISVEDLNSSQYADLMAQFAATHVEEIDTIREDFGKNIPPVHITITDSEVTEITSPNFPNTYPTNNVIDWILEGEGTGIELNVTDLEIRGIQGDFLLIKPGGADDSGHDGILFSYHLNEPRLFRFTDVSRVFVRFQSGPGLGFLKGFRMTVKMIWPRERVDLEETPPTPAPLLPSPPATFTVTLGGFGKKDFLPLSEDFRRLLGDMAAMYMFAQGIDAADNSTSEVTQITSISSCNVNWPGWEQCVLVTFGVPLVYDEEGPTRLDEEDLKSMWETYSAKDPFATRLKLMGITEFEVPDDGRVMLTWLVLELGAMICAVLLAFALWRYSCIQDYTRMKSFSDTDSVHEKRGLDLYPTPHQTLPPLFTETDYQWADQKYDESARVDIGGFTNSSFARDELLDIESDEEVVAARDSKNTSIAPRNPYDYPV